MKPSARLSARAGGDNNNGNGGVIQISSTYDVEGLCEDNIDVSSQSGEDGLCTIRGKCLTSPFTHPRRPLGELAAGIISLGVNPSRGKSVSGAISLGSN